MQFAIEEAMLTLEYLPAGHCVHERLAELVVENEPTAHGWHTVELLAPSPPVK